MKSQLVEALKRHGYNTFSAMETAQRMIDDFKASGVVSATYFVGQTALTISRKEAE